MKHLRYKGEFYSYSGVKWRAEIWQESPTEFSSIGILEFDVSPLSIEWQRTDKEEVICSSSATLKIISPGDRSYIDLYTIAPCDIRLDVYRNDSLYWSGCLDPEFYEEPYEMLKGYTVSLTFSDFGVLDRLKYEASKMMVSVKDVIENALSGCAINYTAVDTSLISTTHPDGTAIYDTLQVRSDNFIDEDGELSTLKEVVEGVLQPLALRITQRNGKVYLYDINALYNSANKAVVQWDGDSQTLGVDKVVNNVKVTFSPYGKADALTPDSLEYKGKYGIDKKNLPYDAPSDTEEYGEYYSYYPEQQQAGSADYLMIDFTIFDNVAKYGKGGLASINDKCRYFHILPVTGSASECSGVAWMFHAGGHTKTAASRRKVIDEDIPRADDGRVVFTTERIYLPSVSEADARNYRVRVVEELLLDYHYNPFSSSASLSDEDMNRNSVADAGAKVDTYVFIPCKIRLYDEVGNVTHHYSNRAIVYDSCIGHISYAQGEWVEGDDTAQDCYLEYYDPNDYKKSGIGGWKGNRQAIGRPGCPRMSKDRKIYPHFANMADGEYLPYPQMGGYLEIQVLAGAFSYCIDGSAWLRLGQGYDFGQYDAWRGGYGDATGSGGHKNMRWALYKCPTIEIVNYNLAFDKAELEDVEYSGYINKQAKDGISIDTVCGTNIKVSPNSRGAYYRSDGTQVLELKRAGRTDHPEKLLIGTLYSQFSDRRVTLSGEARIEAELTPFVEANQDGKVLMLMSDVQDVITDCTDAEYCEIRPDEYGYIEEVDE